MIENKKHMILCAGLQSSGSTLISWCFLQHADISGELDMLTDKIRLEFDSCNTPWIWNKMTISSFRWFDLAKLYEDLGWTVYPLLVARDVRPTFASLQCKEWGINSNTSEDPPLRVRFRRFLQDWELFQRHKWPVIKFEDFINDPVVTLKEACLKLGIEWDDGMIYWTKTKKDIFNRDHYNQTFFKSIKGKKSLFDSIQFDKIHNIKELNLIDLKWLESQFMEYNRALGYPKEVALKDYQPQSKVSTLLNPSVARRVVLLRNYKELQYRVQQLQHRYNQLQSEFNRLQRTRAMRFSHWLNQHPMLSALFKCAYDKTVLFYRKKKNFQRKDSEKKNKS